MRDTFAAVVVVRRLRAAAGARLGAAVGGRRRADGSRDRQRRDRHAAARCRRAPAPGRGRRDPAKRAHLRVGGGAVHVDCGGPRRDSCSFLPDPAPTLAPRRWRTWRRAASAIPSTGVLFVYRALDTLLEKVVLVLALRRRLVAGARSSSGAALRDCGRSPTGRHSGFPRPVAAADRDRGRHLHVLGRRRSPGRRLPGRRGAGRHVAPRHDGRACGLRPRSSLVALRLSCVAGPVIFLAIGLAGFVLGGRLPRLSGGLRQAADHRRRGRVDAVDRRDARPAGGWARRQRIDRQ